AKMVHKSENDVRTKAQRLGLSRSRERPAPTYRKGDLVYIPLSSQDYPNMVAWVDRYSFPRVAQYRWSFELAQSGMSYTRARVNGKVIRMHQLIVECPPGMHIRHADGNGLNNTHANLIILPPSGMPPKGDDFKGVSRRGNK